jgi:ATP-dependent protease ClpP protease subunit
MKKNTWFSIGQPQAAASGPSQADVFVYDGIGMWGIDASEFVTNIASLDVDQINLFVNSPGGNVYDAIAMTNALKRHPATVVATIDGLAASAASFLITAADEVVMGQNSELMIHDAWGVTIGSADDMRDAAVNLDRVSDNIASMYAAHAGGSAESWRLVMLAETWYSAEEAVGVGMADRVDSAAQAPADKFDLSVFAHAGREDAPEPPIELIRAFTRTENVMRADAKQRLIDSLTTESIGYKKRAQSAEAKLRALEGTPELTELDELQAELDTAATATAEKLPNW